MRIRIVAGLVAAFGFIGASTGASAAIWAWGCQAQVGAQQIIFNRYSMVVVDTKQKMGDVRRLRPTEIDPPPGLSRPTSNTWPKVTTSLLKRQSSSSVRTMKSAR